MKTTSLLFRCFLRCVIPVIVICVLLGTSPIQPALADAAPGPDPAIGGAGPYQPQKTNVQMMAETVLIDVSGQPPKPDQGAPIHQSASFSMRNQGQTEEKMQVIFPLTQLTAQRDEQSEYTVDLASFVVRVDGARVPITEIDTPAEPGYQLEFTGQGASPTGGFLPDVRWASFEVTFPVHKNVLLQVEYDMVTYPEIEFTSIEYILETGAGWYGNILSADIILRLPYPASQDAIGYANPNYTLSGNEIRWHLRDFEPTRDDNLVVSVYPSKTWHAILALRARVAQNPQSADAWSALGDGYMPLAIPPQRIWEPTDSIWTNMFFNALAIQAYRKALAFRPAWGDPHVALATLIWVQKPENHDIQLEDPLTQQALNELDAAWSFGVTRVGEAAYLLHDMNRTIPGLELRLQPAPKVALPQFPTQSPGAHSPANKISDDAGVNMLLVPSGTFTMGSDNDAYTDDQKPSHKVYLDAYYMDQYEVTNAHYMACVRAGICAPPPYSDRLVYPDYYSNPGFGDYPVESTWEMASIYCSWRGNGTRLPTEAEWEKASRGPDGRPYPWGVPEPHTAYPQTAYTKANYENNTGAPRPVGSFPADRSPYGIYDTAGNVSEWVSDWYSDTYYQVTALSNPLGPDTGKYRVYRGGSWYEFSGNSSSSYRGRGDPQGAYFYGFRCARPLGTTARGLPTLTPAAPVPTRVQPTPSIANQITDETGVQMQRVPAGSVKLEDGKQIYLDTYDIDQDEVTNALYRACVAGGTCQPPKRIYSYTRPNYYKDPAYENYPVVEVDWYMARTYCQSWRSARLPLDAEWIRAAGGSSTDPASQSGYPWGDGIDQGRANYRQNIGDTSSVGAYKRGQSPYAIDDLGGNVWEWVADGFPFYESDNEKLNPLGSGSEVPTSIENFYSYNLRRWIRGGSWYNDGQVLGISNRDIAAPTSANLLIGFRCARSLPPTPAGQVSKQSGTQAADNLIDDHGVPMRRVPAGVFIMGSENGNANEKPAHKVYLANYAIDQYEVNRRDPKTANPPITGATWNEAEIYCQKRGARLPTEAEWEKAARGTNAPTYPWGEGLDSAYANYNGLGPVAVGSYEKGRSVYGVYDMAGNVWEWVNDWYDATYYQASPSTNPQGPGSGEYHVLRGGGWYFPDLGVRSSFRTYGLPKYARFDIGFRCARSLP